MSIYDNNTSKIYPDLKPTAPQKPQAYRLKNWPKLRHFFDEIGVRERIVKKMKQFNKITGIVGNDLITSTVIAGGISIAALGSGICLPLVLPWVELAYFFFLQQPSRESILKSSP